MGKHHAKAAVTQVITNKTINQSTLNMLNETISKTVYNSVQQSSSSCDQSGDLEQTFTFTNLTAKGNIKITTGQTQDQTVNFNCIQEDTFDTGLSNNIMKAIDAQLTNNLDSSTMTKLRSLADARAKDSGLNFPWKTNPSTDSKVNQKVSNYTKNTTNDNIKDIIKNSAYYSIVNKSFSSCFAKEIENQMQTFKNIESKEGSINITSFQTQTQNVVSHCIQMSNMSNHITQTISDALGLMVENDTTANNGTDAIGKAKSTSTLGGIFGDLFSGLFASILPYFASFFGTSSSSLSCILIIFIIFFIFRSLNK